MMDDDKPLRETFGEIENYREKYAELEPSRADIIPDKLTPTWVRGQVPIEIWRQIGKPRHAQMLTPHMIVMMHEDVKRGLSKTSVLARAGAHRNNWPLWERKAAEGIEPYALWYRCMMHAASEMEQEQVENVRGHAMSDWKAATWLLTHGITRDEWFENKTASTTNVRIEGDTGTKVTINTIDEDKAKAIANLWSQIVPPAIEGEVVSDTEDAD